MSRSRFTLAVVATTLSVPAFAADLPSRKAAPVDYVRICKIGDKFAGFVIPGSDTCLAVGGRVRFDAFYNERFWASPTNRGFQQATQRFRARGYLTLDAQTPTEIGVVRTAIRMYIQQTTGGATASGTGADGAYLDYAFIQAAGFTAGRYFNSFYDFAYASGISQNSYIGGASNGRGSDTTNGAITPPAVAYTAKFGDFAATIALEDSYFRQSGVFLSPGAPTVTPAANGGTTVPDLVGRIEYGAGWGVVALTGAAHQIRPNASTPEVDSEYGYAGQLGVKVNLPFLAAGDNIVAQVAYSRGANAYTGTATNAEFSESVQAGSRRLNTADATVVGDSLKLTQVWQGYAGLQHFWTPTINSTLYGTYAQINQFGNTRDAGIATGALRVSWFPIKKTEVGIEAVYTTYTDTPAGFIRNSPNDNKSDWQGRIRFQRDF
jgi:hypothetical protein